MLQMILMPLEDKKHAALELIKGGNDPACKLAALHQEHTS